MNGGTLAALAIALPLGGALLVLLAGRWPNLREAVTLVTGAATFGLVATIVPRVQAGETVALTLLELMPGISLRLSVEPLGMLFALVASGLWIVTSLYAIGYMRGHHEENQTRFYACFAVSIGCALGVAFAGNLVTLFAFYELLTISTYPLVTHHGTPEAVRAGRVYLGILIGTSVAFLLTAIIWTWTLAGTLEFRPGGILAKKIDWASLPILVGLYAFGIGKAALMPFHRWLPAAMVAPTPVSALLHAVAVVKAGVFSILKIVVYVLGPDFLRTTGASEWLTWVAAATILLASMVAWTKDNLKARLAYSTVSQLSYIVLGAALANKWGLLGGGMHIAMHAVGKITLFFCAGAILVASHKTEISQMAGIGRRMPVTMAAYTIGALSVIGVPPCGGSWGKWFLALGAAESSDYVLLGVLLASSLLNIAYLMPVAVRAFFAEPRPEPHEPAHAHEHGEAPLFCVAPLCITAAGCVAMFFLADSVYRLLEPIVRTGGAP